jgi:hypothetical protein
LITSSSPYQSTGQGVASYPNSYPNGNINAYPSSSNAYPSSSNTYPNSDTLTTYLNTETNNNNNYYTKLSTPVSSSYPSSYNVNPYPVSAYPSSSTTPNDNNNNYATKLASAADALRSIAECLQAKLQQDELESSYGSQQLPSIYSRTASSSGDLSSSPIIYTGPGPAPAPYV